MITESDKQKKALSSLYFDVDSQLISELGERLVTNNYVALGELIKNAYDADSPSVEIELINITKSQDLIDSEIIIRDKGHGMTFEEIDLYWMTIATSNKLEHPVSKKHGRPKTGNKGVGRFSCQKLAHDLVLESVAKVAGGYEKTIVTFNWSDFKPGMKLEKIPCVYDRLPAKRSEEGVTLRLKGLRDPWTERDYKMFQKNVALISVATPTRRKGYTEDPGFKIAILNDDFETDLNLLDDKILNSGWGKLVGKVLKSGVLNLQLESKGSEKQKFNYRVNNKNLSGISFVIYIMPGDSMYDYIESRRNATILTKSLRRQIWEKQSGIKVYYDGFRIYPYGDIENEDDWLGMVRDVGRRRGSPSEELDEVGKAFSNIPNFTLSRSMLNHPAARAHVGAVYIDGDAASAFSQKMDREGLEDGKNLTDLKKTIRLATDWSALYYEAFIRTNVANKREVLASKFDESIGEKPLTTRHRIDNAIEFLKNSAKEDAPHVNKKDDIFEEKPIKTGQSNVSVVVDYLDSQFDDFSAELDTLRSVASTAPLMFVFSHEVKGITTSLLNHSSKLKDLSKKCTDKKIAKDLLTMSDQARLSVSRYGKLIKLFDVFSDSQNFSKKKAKLENAVSNIVSGFDFLLSTFKIDLSVSDINPLLRVSKLNEAQLYSLVINTLSNAIKAVIAKNGRRKIFIEVVDSDSLITIAIRDTGVGLKPKNWDKVFKPFEYDPEGKIYSVLSNALGDEQLATLGKGSGLGLHIVKNIIDDAGGKVNFSECKNPWVTCLKMEIPK